MFMLGVCILTLSTVISVSAQHVSLFTEEDPVLQIWGNTQFDSEIYGKSNAWIVVFYYSWCGHCQRFAPKFQALSLEIKDWGDVVKPVTINCASNINTALCREQNIGSVPHIKFLKPLLKKGEKGVQYHMQKGHRETATSLSTSLANFLKKQARSSVVPSNWPSFEPLESVEELREVWSNLKRLDHTMLIVLHEATETALGPLFLLHMMPFDSVEAVWLVSEDTGLWMDTRITLPAVYGFTSDYFWLFSKQVSDGFTKALAESIILEAEMAFFYRQPTGVIHDDYVRQTVALETPTTLQPVTSALSTDHYRNESIDWLTPLLQNSSTAIVVLFCRSTIERCKIYQTGIWWQFQKQIGDWNNIVLDAQTVDCSTYDIICSDFNITRYPTIKFFRANEQLPDISMQLHGRPSVRRLLRVSLAHIESHDAEKCPELWPDLGRVWTQDQVNNIETSADIPDDINYIVLLSKVRFGGGFTAKQVILDAANIQNVLAFEANLPLDTLNADKVAVSAPNVQIIRREANGTWNSPELLDISKWRRADIMHAVNEYLRSHVQPSNDSNSEVCQVYMNDLETALWSTLSTNIFVSNEDLANETLDALRSLLKTYSQNFPGTEPVMKKLKSLTDWVDNEEKVSVSDYLSELNAMNSSELIRTDTQYIECRGSQPHLRGFTCATWMTYHAMTVQAEMLAKSLTDDGNSTHPLQVLQDGLKTFAKYFFKCLECRRNFLEKESVTMDTSVYDYEDAIYWLWKVHNNVNRRLAGATSEDPEHPKIQFPSAKMCPLCHGKVGFRRSEVLHFLRNFYNRDSISL